MPTFRPEAIETARRALIEAADLISDPERWTTWALARNAKGRPLRPCSERAVRWCAHGAIYRALGPEHSALYGSIIQPAIRRARPDGYALITINDHEGREAAIAVLRQVAELLGTDEEATR